MPTSSKNPEQIYITTGIWPNWLKWFKPNYVVTLVIFSSSSFAMRINIICHCRTLLLFVKYLQSCAFAVQIVFLRFANCITSYKSHLVWSFLPKQRVTLNLCTLVVREACRPWLPVKWLMTLSGPKFTRRQMHPLHLLPEKGQLGEVKLSEYQPYVLTCECQSDVL